jgi:hypothetical protein
MRLMAALDAAWALVEASDDPAILAKARDRARLCGQMAATARKIAAMTPAEKAAKAAPEAPMDRIHDLLRRTDALNAEVGASASPAPSNRKPAAQAVAMRAALRKLKRQ